MAKMTTEELLDVFKEMTILELSELKKAFEDEFDVTAAAPAAVIAAAPGDGGGAAERAGLHQGGWPGYDCRGQRADRCSAEA